jgi:hypothetical protein
MLEKAKWGNQDMKEGMYPTLDLSGAFCLLTFVIQGLDASDCKRGIARDSTKVQDSEWLNGDLWLAPSINA